jgi:mannose-6-phosphate isomerase-like protein (cupin superfamily)
MEIHFRDGKVTLTAGEMFVAPKGIEHKPYAASECKHMLVEPIGTVNTGDARYARYARRELTAENDV